MPRAGSFGYPSRDLDDCISYLRRARESLKTRETTREGFARAIGLSAGGGGFGKLVGALTEYGLVETGRNQISTTELSEQILFGTRDEQREAREKSVEGVRLFAEIYGELGKEPSVDQLRMFLRERTGVDMAAAKSVAEEIGKLLRNNSPHVSGGPSPRTSAKAAAVPDFPREVVARLEMADYGILNIRDEISMDLAMRLLVQVKKSKGWSESADSTASADPIRKKSAGNQ